MIDPNKISVRPWLISDISSLMVNANNEKIGRTLTSSFPYPYTENNASDWINTCIRSGVNEQLCICLDDQAIGAIGITVNKTERHSGEIGYWLGVKYWNLGITTCAVRIFSEYCFNDLKMEVVQARVIESNVASQQVLLKAGFSLQNSIINQIENNYGTHNALLFIKHRQ